jgi:hypothetical protein
MYLSNKTVDSIPRRGLLGQGVYVFVILVAVAKLSSQEVETFSTGLLGKCY